MVNKENMRLWVAALRSGKFQQGQNALKRQYPGDPVPRHCCLGVACEIAVAHGVNLEISRLTTAHYGTAEPTYTWRFNGTLGALPSAVVAWLGVGSPDSAEDQDPVVGLYTPHPEAAVPVRAIKANDELRWDFLRIADGLEKYYDLKEGEDGPEQGTPAPVD